MVVKRGIWKPLLAGLSIVNLAAVGVAAGASEPWHAAGHAALALVLGLWSQKLRPSTWGGEVTDRVHQATLDQDRLNLLEADLTQLRMELSEAQERLDFAERLLMRGREADKANPAHEGQ
jgi:hypothetical protein